MLATGKFTRAVGAETNTIIRWLREGIAIPEPTEGRNNVFSYEEVIAVRAVVPLYQEWALKSDLLRGVSRFMRDMLSIRKELGYADHVSFIKDICLWRAVGTMQIAQDKNFEGQALDDYRNGIRDGAEHKAKQWGVTLPQNWQDDQRALAKFTGETAKRVRRYERIIGTAKGIDDWYLFVSRDADGEWNWAVADFNGFRDQFQSDATTFVTVDLAKALAD